ncbi:MAG: hypothetical protein WA001_05775 [Patescibacteria group bacterium]
MKRPSSLKSYLLLVLPCALFVVASLFVRQASAAPNCWSVTDPAGDVTIQGATSSASGADLPASDILAASVATSSAGWIFTVMTSAPLVAPNGQVANLAFMIDADGKMTNNYTRATNERAGADTFFVIISTASSTNPWKVEHEEYDASSAQWKATPADLQIRFLQNVATVIIPANELPATTAMRWRAVTDIGVVGKWFTRDSAPEHVTDSSACGYMPYPASTSTAPLSPASASSSSRVTAASQQPPSANWLAYLLVALGLAAMGIGVAKGKG